MSLRKDIYNVSYIYILTDAMFRLISSKALSFQKYIIHCIYVILCSILAVISFSAGIDFRRQNLTSKVNPRTEKNNMFTMAVYP